MQQGCMLIKALGDKKKKKKARKPQTLKFFTRNQKRNVFLLLLLASWHAIFSRQCRSPDFLFYISRLPIFTLWISQRWETPPENAPSAELSKIAVHQSGLDLSCWLVRMCLIQGIWKWQWATQINWLYSASPGTLTVQSLVKYYSYRLGYLHE